MDVKSVNLKQELDDLRKEEMGSIIEEYNKAKQSFIEKGKVILKQAMKSYFEENPKIAAITWTQYTPFFNDGEPCTFRIGDLWPLTKSGLKAFKEDSGYGEEYSIGYEYDEDLTPEEIKLAETGAGNIAQMPDDIFEDLFGDHVYVIATKKGFTVEEYEHD